MIYKLAVLLLVTRMGEALNTFKVSATLPQAHRIWTWIQSFYFSLEDRQTPAACWRVPCADHCPQVYEPGLIADIVRATLAEEMEGQACRAVQIQANQ